MTFRPVALLVWVLVLLAPAPSLAHQASVAYVEVTVKGRGVVLDLRASRHHLAPVLGVADGINPVAELFLSKRDEVLAGVAGYLTVRLDGRQLCTETKRTMVRVTGEEVALRFSYRCPRRVERLTLRYDLLFDADPRHRALVRVAGEGASRATVLGARDRVFELRRQVSAWDNAGDYLVLGIEHIFTGYDHVVFLFGLLLAVVLAGGQVGGVRRALTEAAKVVTAFTAAHSVTLVGAALELVTLPSALVESAIALSIAYVGLENTVVTQPRRRWALTFAFGLVHGFGFAHVLADIGLPQSGLVLSLAAFNFGVELGQLALVALLLPLIYLLAMPNITLPRSMLVVMLSSLLVVMLAVATVAVGPYVPVVVGGTAALCLGAHKLGYRNGVLRPASVLIAAFGLMWAAQRIFNFTLFSGWLG